MRIVRKFNVVRTQTIERNYECAGCGTRAVATLRARGESGWKRHTFLDDYQEADARSDAAYAMHDDADRIMALMHCPACGQRAPRAVMWSVVRLAMTSFVVAIAVLATFWAHGEFGLPAWVSWAALGLGVAVAGGTELRRWREALKGERSLANVRPPAGAKALPQAIARERPPAPAPPPAPIAPLRTAAPDRESAPPGDGPRLLK